MNKKTLTIAALVVVAVIVAFFVGRVSVSQPEFVASGTTPTGTQLIEDYVPIVKYNGGLYTALPIQTTSDITAVTITGTTLAGVISGSTGTFSSTLGVTGLFTADGGILQSSVLATSSTGAGTLTQADITGISTILSTNAGALTLTLPASTTLTTFVPTAGDRVSVVLVNQGTALLTLAGGTGTLLQTASSTKTVNIGGTTLLEFVRKTNTDVVVLMSPAI